MGSSSNVDVDVWYVLFLFSVFFLTFYIHTQNTMHEQCLNCIARNVGNRYNEGIYDIHIHLRHIPFLEFDPPFWSKYLRVQNIMTKDPVCLDHVVQVRTVYDVLKSNRHYAFPVVMPQKDSSSCIFTGVIFRKHLCTLLKRKDFFEMRPLPFKRKPYDDMDFDHSECIPDNDHSLSYLDFNAQYPRWPKIETIQLDEDDMDKWMDLTPYMNPTPHTMQEMVRDCTIYNISFFMSITIQI